ncbi:MAG: hypothetical protein BWY76_01506 [bacterium ADurb.Bin429]|nr:MAG: hypothetical protein BWY76_01506 [bacterium ADurb.Bin429]
MVMSATSVIIPSVSGANPAVIPIATMISENSLICARLTPVMKLVRRR